METIEPNTSKNSEYAEFWINYASDIARSEQLLVYNKNGLEIIERMCWRLNSFLIKGDVSGAQIVLDSFLDWYVFDRKKEYNTIPESLKEFIRVAIRKIAELNHYLVLKNNPWMRECLIVMEIMNHIMSDNK